MSEVNSNNATWRKQSVEQHETIASMFLDSAISKWQAGQEEHGVVFTADPLDEASQEVIDLVFYLDRAVRQRGALIHEIKRLEDLLNEHGISYQEWQGDPGFGGSIRK